MAQNAASEQAITALYSDAKAAQLAGDNKTAILKYEQILKIAPRTASVYNNLGILYIAAHDLPQAVTVLQQGLRIDPQMKSSTALLGLTLFQMSEFERARPYLRAAVKNNPKDFTSRMLLAKDLINLHQEDAAAQELHAIVAVDPNSQEAWYLLGKAHLNSSIEAMRKAGEIDPNSALSHEMAGEVMESLRSNDEAIVEYEKAIRIAPSQPGLHLQLADLLSELGNWESARKNFLAELENDPNNCRARWMAAHSLLEANGPPESAISELDKAVTQCSYFAGPFIDRARAFLALGRTPEAFDDLLRARTLNNNDPTIHFLLARVYREQNRKSDADEELNIYKTLKEAAHDTETTRVKEVEKAKSELR